MIIGKYYKGLDHFEDVKEIRKVVFGEELGYTEELNFDGFDKQAIHAVAYLDRDYIQPVGIGRLIQIEEGYKIGRIAIKKEARKCGYGEFIVRMLVDKGLLMGADRVLVGAQPHAIEFYRKIGFRPVGESYVEAGIEHTVMEIKQNTICKACQGHTADK